MAERPVPGIAEEIAPGIRRVLAPNPSPMTHWGTNSYLLGSGEVAVIDPGPDDDRHLEALLAAIGTTPVRAILVTHAHRDHTDLAPRLAGRTGAPILAFGPPEAGRSTVMARLAETGLIGGGEGVDRSFRPHSALSDGDILTVGGTRIEAVHTPGHFPGHLSFAADGILFSGDHVMEWSTTLISPPEGDVAAFLVSCARLQARSEHLYLPGHGDPVTDPAARLAWLVAHRREREAQILDALAAGHGTAEEIASRVYAEISPTLLPAATRNVFAHLVDLTERNLATPDLDLTPGARFRLV